MKKLLSAVLSVAILTLVLAGCNLAGIEYPDASGASSEPVAPEPIVLPDPTPEEERIINISWAIIPAEQEGTQRRAEYMREETINGQAMDVYDVYNVVGASEQMLGTFAMAPDAETYYLLDWLTEDWRSIIIEGDNIYLADFDDSGASSDTPSEWDTYGNDLFGIQLSAPAGMDVNDMLETDLYFILDGNGMGCVISKTPSEHDAAGAFALLNEDLELTRSDMAIWATDAIGIEGFTLGGNPSEAEVAGYSTFYRETFTGTWGGVAVNEGVVAYGAGDGFTVVVLVFSYGEEHDSATLEAMLDSLVLT